MTPEERIAQLERQVQGLLEWKQKQGGTTLQDGLAYNTMDRTKLRKLTFYGETRSDPEEDGEITYKLFGGVNRLMMNMDGLKRSFMFKNYLDLPDPTDVTIASGAITVTQGYHTVETEGAASTDDLDTINDSNLEDVTLLILRATSSTRTVVVKDGTGNLRLAGDCTLDNGDDTITLIGTGGIWYEIARSNNAA